ncbi:hypothetical protein [Enhygromyxa salina]|uniref:Uncharacterized protein n=1 Tax=Enhygromyxa salina TaxID=215803 RepID=A0A2S9XQZ6_9BACT|nr:hypothetical protein [Enhygromyxa salina]PRP95111.1 hypothetical protein ENSA7_74250 [Enhygromyxa salina]
MTSSKLLCLVSLLSLAACDIPSKSIGDDDGGSTTDVDEGGDNGDGDPADCEALCGSFERECEYDACCSCAMAGGSLIIYESYPPQYACDMANGPLPGWESPICDWGNCEDQVSELAIDEVFEPAGVTPQQVIDVIGPPMETSHVWDDADVQLNVPGPMTVVSFTATPTGTYRGVEGIWVPPEDLPNLEGECSSRVEVDVDVSLTTTDGALNEAFEGVVYSSGDANLDFNSPGVALRHYFASDGGFNGTLELSAPDAQSTLDPEAQLNVQFGRIDDGGDPPERFGSLTVGVEVITDEWAGYGWAEFGLWWDEG